MPDDTHMLVPAVPNAQSINNSDNSLRYIFPLQFPAIDPRIFVFSPGYGHNNLPRFYTKMFWKRKIGSMPARAHKHAPVPVPETDEDAGKKILVLDMDETLIHKSTFPPHQSIELLPVDFEGCFIFKRPGVDEFLARVTSMFKTYIFTAGEKEYAQPLLDVLCPMIPESRRFYRDSCNTKKGKCKKNLKLLTKNMAEVVLVDDSPNIMKFYPRNVLQITRWNGTPIDACLLEEVLPILEQCARARDVRDVIDNVPKKRTRRAFSELVI